MLTAIRQWVIKTMMKNKTGVVQTLPKRDLIELNTQITAQRLMQNGVNPESLTNVNQVENVINQIDNSPKINIDTGRNQSGIKSTKSAKVMDMEGKEIPSGSKIMGGKATETEAEIAARINRENKKSVGNIKNKMTEIDEAIDNASPGFAGDRKYDAQLVADDLAEKRFGKEFYDLDEIDQMNIYDEAYQGLSKQRFKNKNPIDDPEDLAQGGRAGYANGTPNKKITIDAAGSKSGKQQIMGAPEGITMDNESINAIIKADIPISQKIDLLAKYQYGKGRTRIERDDQEIVLDEGGFKSRDIGLGFNKAGEGIGGTLMYNLETGEPQFNIGFKKFFADGGRIGLKAGMTKRAFLKLMGGVGAGIAGLKSGLLGLGGKQATKEVAKEIITTPAAAGKPAWFDALVTRVIREGDDVTKTMATKDREIVYRKKIDDETEVLVTQDLDEGVTRIDIDDSTRNVTGFDDPPTVSLQVTDEIVEEGGAKIKPEFKATENDYRNYTTDPDGGYETEFVENTVENTKDLTSDLTKVKSYATNKKETMKEFVESKKRKDNVKYANENPSSYAADRGPDYDPSDYIDDMADDFASGGIARMLGE